MLRRDDYLKQNVLVGPVLLGFRKYQTRLLQTSWAALFGVTIVTLAPGAALAVSSEVRSACKSDYYAYCSKYSVGTPELKQCMRGVGEGLSAPCLVALVNAGEITKADIDKFHAKQAGASAATAKKPDAANGAPAKKHVAAANTDGKAPKSAKGKTAATEKKSAGLAKGGKKGKIAKGSEPKPGLKKLAKAEPGKTAKGKAEKPVSKLKKKPAKSASAKTGKKG